MTDIADEHIRIPRVRKPVGLALQGGGSWGAYTWGVLDALLASRSIAIAQLSGTSAGAINAAIVASAIAQGKPAHARKLLRSFWLAVAQPAVADLGREVWGPVERRWRETVGTWLIANSAMSPYRVNPLGINPLRDAIAAHVDIDAIRGKSAPPLYVTLTNVRTGLARVVANDAMTIEALLASACLPQFFQAVAVDGEPYWDGGYSGNPTLGPMIHGGPARDLIVVQLTPDAAPDVPKDARRPVRARVGARALARVDRPAVRRGPQGRPPIPRPPRTRHRRARDARHRQGVQRRAQAHAAGAGERRSARLVAGFALESRAALRNPWIVRIMH